MSELSISADIASAMESGDSTPISASERRRGPDRRKQEVPVAVERRTGRDRRDEADRRAAAGESERRRMVDPTTCERDYGTDETEFMVAMDTYKRANRRPFRRPLLPPMAHCWTYRAADRTIRHPGVRGSGLHATSVSAGFWQNWP